MSMTEESLRADGPVVQGILCDLQEQIGPQRFNAWFRHGVRIAAEEELISVAVPNSFVGNWIETHYQAAIGKAAEQCTGRKRPVVVTIDPDLSGMVRPAHLDKQAEMVERDAAGRSRPRQAVPSSTLRYRLEEFVVGESNKLAYSAAASVVGAAAPPFNPLFIHGSCGVGKTHLLQGVCGAAAKVTRNGRPLACRYVTAEQFTNEFITALRNRKVEEFRLLYRRLDLLAIDDVHFLAAKRATQDEFLHTFNSIQSAGRQVVMASDAHPRLVGELNESLVNRFIAGMVVKVEPPDQATRLAILSRRAKAMRLTVRGEVLEYIAARLRGSVRELEGALIKLAALAALEEGPITVAMADQTLADHLARADSAVTLSDIEAVVAAYFGITPADIHSSRRTRTVSLARTIAMFLARRHTRMSYPEIGRFMGKNHSSAVLAVQRMERALGAGDELSWLTPAGTRSMPAKELVGLLSEQIA
jgi:chromosomal replication initiator protein